MVVWDEDIKNHDVVGEGWIDLTGIEQEEGWTDKEVWVDIYWNGEKAGQVNLGRRFEKEKKEEPVVEEKKPEPKKVEEVPPPPPPPKPVEEKKVAPPPP